MNNNFSEFIEEQSASENTLPESKPLSKFEVFLKDIYNPMVSEQELIECVKKNPEFATQATESGFNALIHAGFSQPYVGEGKDDVRGSLAAYLIEQGANVNQSSVEMGWTPLIANINNTKVALLLLEKGANPNLSLKEGGLSPLTAASTRGNLKVVQSLFEHGVSVDWSAPSGWSPLLSAASFQDVELLKVLLGEIDQEKMAQAVNFQGSAKMSAVHIAARSGNLEGLELLVQAGAQLEVENALGMSALHFASKGGHTKVVEYLIEKGLDPLQCDREGFCAMEYAQQENVKQLFIAYDVKDKKPHPLPLKKGKNDTERISEQIEKSVLPKKAKTLKTSTLKATTSAKKKDKKSAQELIESQEVVAPKEKKNQVKKPR